MKSLDEKALLVNLNLSAWTARKLDKDVTRETNSRYGADREAGRYNKLLVAKDEIDKISKLDGMIRTYHYSRTLPWGDNGDRVILVTPDDTGRGGYAEYAHTMNQFEAERTERVRAFCVAYPELIEDAKRRLNGMFRASDYPSVREIESRFKMAVEYGPIPMAGDFRVALDEKEKARLQKAITDRTEALAQKAMAEAWQRLYRVIEKMADTLGEPDKIFRDTLIGNAAELCELLPSLNITGDKALSDLASQVAQKLCTYEPQELREAPAIRREVAQEARNLMGVVAQQIKAPASVAPVAPAYDPMAGLMA